MRRGRAAATVAAAVAVLGMLGLKTADDHAVAQRAQPLGRPGAPVMAPPVVPRPVIVPPVVLRRAGTPKAERAAFTAGTGALAIGNPEGRHFCTASAVASPHHNVLVTAAHCIHQGEGGGYRSELYFVPSYRPGHRPSIAKPIRRMLVDRRWAQSSDPDLDVGFLIVARGKSKVPGEAPLAFHSPFISVVQVTGYPDEDDEPITCANKTSAHSGTQLRFACDGYEGGTSGSPWVAGLGPTTRTGEIIGVIGGYQEGGATPHISYSPYFGDAVKDLYDRAVRLS
jgi:V8-like Glu-specific endopeptidase